MKKLILLTLLVLCIVSQVHAAAPFTSIQLRRDTPANWVTYNPVLAAGETGCEMTGSPLRCTAQKVGDGVTAWSSLPYTNQVSKSIQGDYSDTILKADEVITKGSMVDVRAFMDGQSGRPTLAAWKASPGTVDIAAVIQTAINATPSNGTLLIPDNALVKSNLPLLFTRSIQVRGGSIMVDPSVPSNTDIMVVAPTSPAVAECVRFSHLKVSPLSGTPGRDVLRIYTWKDGTTEHTLSALIVDELCQFYAWGGYAIRGISGQDNNGVSFPIAPDGIFHTRVENNVLYGAAGGIKFTKFGDSNKIVSNVITGQGLGIEVSMLNASDPYHASSSLKIDHNNITSSGGTIKVTDAHSVAITENNTEWHGSNGYAISVSGMDPTYVYGTTLIRHNKINPTGLNGTGTDTPGSIYVNNLNGPDISENFMETGLTVGNLIYLDHVYNAIIYRNQFNFGSNATGINVSANAKYTIICDDNIFGWGGVPGTMTPVATPTHIPIADNGISTIYRTWSNAVTYTGATTDVDLGGRSLSAQALTARGISQGALTKVSSVSIPFSEMNTSPLTGYTAQAGWSISTSTATASGVSGGYLYKPMGITAGKTYTITYTVTVTSGGCRFMLEGGGSGVGTVRTASGTYTETVTSAGGAGAGAFYFTDGGSGFGGSIDLNSVSVALSGTQSGPLIAAVAGTDYLQPSNIGVSVQGYNANTTLLGNTVTGTGGSIVMTGTNAASAPSIYDLNFNNDTNFALWPSGTKLSGLSLYTATNTFCITGYNGGAVKNIGCFVSSDLSAQFSGRITAAGGSANHAICWKADGKTLGYCSNVVASDGTCGTCN